MSLKVYEEADPGSAYSVSGIFANPFVESIDGRVGGSIERKLYVRNDDNTYAYSGVNIQPVSFQGRNLVSGQDGFSWKINSGSTRPTEQEWTTISGGIPITLSDLGAVGSPDTSTYLPFWLQVNVPSGVDIQTFSGTTLRITATELLV